MNDRLISYVALVTWDGITQSFEPVIALLSQLN